MAQKIFKKILMIVLGTAALLFAVFLSLSYLPDKIGAAAEGSPDTNYWFESIRTEIAVNRDKTFAVREYMKVGFTEGGTNTGIIRDIQRVSITTRIVDGEQKSGRSYLAKLSDVQVTIDGAAAKVTQSYYDAGQFFSVKMQKPDESFFEATDEDNGTGFHDFALFYTYDMSDDKTDGFDDFTFDVLGYAMAYTKNFSAKVTFPTDLDASAVSVRTNDKKEWLPADGESWSVEDNVLTLTARPDAKNRGYTVQALFPNGYFDAQVTHFWYYWLFAVPAVAVIAAGVVALVKYLPRKAVEPVETMPPKGISLMRASALWYGEVRLKDVPALILEWAAKGYVTLEQDGKRDIIIRKVQDLPVKEGNHKTRYFNALFSPVESGDSGDTLSTKKLRRSWTRGAATKERKLYYAAQALTKEADSPDPIYKGHTLAVVILYFSSILPILLMLIYDMILAKNALALFFFVFLAAATAINYPVRSGIFAFIPLIFMFTFPIPALGWLLFGSFKLYDYASLYIVSAVWWAVAYILHFFMLRRSPEANADLGRLKGFKRFILTAELPRIKLLFDENPEWFSSVLPYCYVMGISKKVEKRYCALGIAAPDWLNGSSVHSMSRCVSRGIGSCGGGGGHGGSGGGGRGGSSGGGGGGGGSRGC